MYFIGTTNITTEEKKIITLEDVLGFITGATHVPPMGFSSTIEIHFIEGQHPKSSTCSLHMYLPLDWMDYSNFKTNVIEALVSGYGFGFC